MVFAIFFSLVYFLFLSLTLRMEISYIVWQDETQAQMTMDMLVMDSVSCALVSISLPAFLAAFLVFGSLIRKTLKTAFKGQFESHEQSIMLAMVLLEVGLALVVVRFTFESMAQTLLQTWVTSMV